MSFSIKIARGIPNQVTVFAGVTVFFMKLHRCIENWFDRDSNSRSLSELRDM